MRKLILMFSIIVFFLMSCEEVKREYSATLHEDAFVADVAYTPSYHGNELGLSAFKTGPIGMDYSGNVGLRIGGGLQISSVTVPEKFAVVFKCQHGKFIVAKQAIYEQLKNSVGQTVDVAYREIYRTTYDNKSRKEKQVVDRVLISYDFLSATLKK